MQLISLCSYICPVDLAKVGVADQPIMVDITPPFAGIVNDGATFKTDQQFSKDADQVQFKHFLFYFII